MYWVVTDIKDHQETRVLEKGPRLRSLDEAEPWAHILSALDYKAFVETMDKGILTESNGIRG